jgi:hypothetical protein
LFFTTVGSAALSTAVSYWVNLDRENAYRFQDELPSIVKHAGGYLGLPVDPATGELDREVLGPRDVRDLVGEDVELLLRLKDGSRIVSDIRDSSLTHLLGTNVHVSRL